MLSLPRITPISRPGSVLAFSSTSSAISTRACHGGSSYGSRAEQERSCHQEDQRKAGAKSKNPARCSVVLALGESNNKTIETSQKTRHAVRQDHTVPCGVSTSFHRRLPHRRVKCTTVFKTLQEGAWAAHIKQWRFEQHFRKVFPGANPVQPRQKRYPSGSHKAV